MNLSRVWLLAGCCLTMQTSAALGCEAYWADFAGKGENFDLQLARTWSLSELRSMRPSAVAFVAASDGESAPQYRAELQWVPGSGSDSPLAPLGSLHLHWIQYSAHQALLAWGRDDDSLCPALMVDGDPSIVDRVDAPETISVKTGTLFNVRVLISGSGGLQSSLFVGVDKAALVHLSQQDFVPLLQKQDVHLHHRGGSFCPGTLTWEGIGWKGASKAATSIWRVQYLQHGRELRIAAAGLVHAGALDEGLCQVQPRD